MVKLVWPGRDEAELVLQQILGDKGRAVPTEGCEPVRPHAFSPTLAPAATLFDEEAPAAPTHRLIRADNMDALCWLLKSGEQFDVIYIDPPYNTGKEFAYVDRPSSESSESGAGSGAVAAEGACPSSRWLSMMYPRLVLAQRVLSQRGLMCVSIDDNEAHHLVTIMREIFGPGSHVATIKWRRKRKPSFLKSHVSSIYEYVLLFAKDPRSLPRLLGKKSVEQTRPVLNQGNSWVERVLPAGTPAICGDTILPAGRQGVRTLAFELLDPLVVSGGRVQNLCRVRGPFRVRQEILDQTVFVTKQRGLRRRVLPEELARQHATDDGTGWCTNEDADAEQQELFGSRVFPFAKPTGMLRQLLRMYPCAAELRCLDFFAGSGSFGHAVLLENREDGCSRQVTLVQSAEPYRGPAGASFPDIYTLMHRRMELAAVQLGLSFSEQFVSFDVRPA
jgi:adenine-specific DNA-methyltransferase